MALTGVGVVGPVAAPAAAAEPTPRRMVSGWLPYWSASSAATVVTANRDLFSDASPFWHSATAATTITSQASASTRADVVAQLRAAGVRVVPAVTDGMAPRAMAAVLANPTTRAQHVAALVALAVTNGYGGLDLDYEKFAFSDGSATWPTTRPAWVTFVRDLAAALHARGLTLTVTTPVIYDADRDGSSGYWVYDWAGIAPYADRLRIMAYDYSVSRAGPIAPLSWVTRVVGFAVTQFPAGRIQLGVPAYGRDWVTGVSGVCPVDNPPRTKSLTASAAKTFAASIGVTPAWSTTHAERTFTYRTTYAGRTSTGAATSCVASRTVWFSDASAVVYRARLVGTYRLAGLALWSLGGEDPAQWRALRGYAQSIAPQASRLAVSATSVLVNGSAGTVLGRLSTASGPVPAGPVLLEQMPAGTSTWSPVTTGRTDSAGYVRFATAPSRTTTYRLRAGSGWSYVGSTSVTIVTIVRPRVGGVVSATAVPYGTAVAIEGAVRPGVPGTAVDLLRRVGTTWVEVGSTTVSSTGTYRIRFVPVRGAATYLVRVAGTSLSAAGYTPAFVVTAS
jgi:spore germination protein YaaH